MSDKLSPSALQAADALLGDTSPSLYAADQMLGPDTSGSLAGDAWNAFFRDPKKGYVNKAFNETYDEAYGKQPLGIPADTEKWFRENGLWNDYEHSNTSWIKTLNESLMRPAAAGMDAAMRTVYAAARGAAATPWWHPAHPIGAVASAALEGAFPELVPHLEPVARAKDAGLLERPLPPPETVARERFAPTGPSATELVLAQPEIREATPAPSTIHEAARQIEPELFAQFDALTDTKNQYWGMIQDETQVPREPSSAVRQLEASLAEARNERSRERIQTRLDEQVAADAAVAKERVDTLRSEMMTVDEQLRDIAPQVSDTLRRARELVPEPPPIEPPTPAEVTNSAPDISRNGDGFDVTTKAGTFFAKTEEEAGRLLRIHEGLTQNDIQNLLQRRPTISADVTRQLVATGMAVEEARANAALVQAHYQARAARFGGALGSARDLYERDDPIIQRGEGAARGRFNIARNTITLMKDADASTFVHETAHQWLEELQRDAEHPAAPLDLKTDLQAVRDWLGVEGAITRKQHEQWARGFERYLMEGVAPSTRLATVFAKFRDWLTRIYQSVSRLRAPINDQIRGVYDRLLSTEPQGTIIASDREAPAHDIATGHELELANTPPEQALEVADRMRAERDLVGSTLKTEIENARQRYRSGASTTRAIARGSAGGEQLPETQARGPTLESERQEPAPSTTEVSPSGATFKAESETNANGEFTETGGRLVDKAGNIRLDNIQAPGDVDAVIRATARYNNDFAPERRLEVTPGQLLGLAEDLGRDPRWLESKNIGEAYNFEEIVAVRQLVKDSANEVRRQMIETAEGGDPLEFAKAIARHEMIMGKASGATAEWGRAGHAFRALNEITGGADFLALDQALRNTGRSYDELLQLARMGKDLPTTGQISNVIQESMADKIKKGVVFVATNGYLSGPHTHAGYAGGNLIRNLLHIPGTAIEAAVGTLRGAETDRVYWREVIASAHGLLHGSLNAWKPAYEAWKTGVQPPLPGQARHGVALWAYDSPFPEAVNKVVGAPGRAVSAIHQFARVQFYTQELYRNAVRDALDRKLGISYSEAIKRVPEHEAAYSKAMQDLQEQNLNGRELQREIDRLSSYPTNDLINRAADEADKMVFQQRMPYHSWFAQLQRFSQDHPIVKLVFPFITVGYNIAKQTERYSPLAPVVTEYRNALMGRTGGAGFDSAMGKVVFGSALLSTGVGLGLAGIVTGPGPSEPKARAAWLESHQPNSLQVGNIWIPLEGLGPHFNLLLFTAGLAQASQFMTKENIDSAAKNYWEVIKHTALAESVFHDLANIGKVLADPEKEGPKFIAGLAGGLVPFSAGLSQINRHILDPHQKEVKPGLEGISDNILSRIPYASNTLYDRRSPLTGETIGTRGFQWYGEDPTIQWLQRLQTGVARPDHTIEGVKMTPMQYDDFARVAGRLTKNLLDQVKPQLERAPRGIQLMEINRVASEARHIARMQLFQNYPQLMIDVTNEKYKKLD